MLGNSLTRTTQREDNGSIGGSGPEDGVGSSNSEGKAEGAGLDSVGFYFLQLYSVDFKAQRLKACYLTVREPQKTES